MTKVEQKIYEGYHNSDVCVAEYLATTPVPKGLTFEDAFLLYVKFLTGIECDRFFRLCEGQIQEYTISPVNGKVEQTIRQIGIV